MTALKSKKGLIVLGILLCLISTGILISCSDKMTKETENYNSNVGDRIYREFVITVNKAYFDENRDAILEELDAISIKSMINNKPDFELKESLLRERFGDIIVKKEKTCTETKRTITNDKIIRTTHCCVCGRSGGAPYCRCSGSDTCWTDVETIEFDK